jgi:hypothetical protein
VTATLEDLVVGDLRIEVAEPDHAGGDAALRLAWLGKSNARQADKLVGPYLMAALARAQELGVPLELHFEKLAHFNSSTIASVIELIQTARQRGARLIVVSDPRRQWQRLSFDALKVFVRPDGLFELRAGPAEGDAP